MKSEVDSKRLLDACMEYYSAHLRAIKQQGEPFDEEDALPVEFMDLLIHDTAEVRFWDEVQPVLRAAIGPNADLYDLEFLTDHVKNLRYDGVYEVSKIAASGGEESDAREIAQLVAGDIESFLEYGMIHEWIACVPIDCRFRGFPPCTDFGTFKIINPMAATESDLPTVTRRFREILASYCEVEFVHALEVENAFDRRADSLHDQSGGYIPVHPQLVVRVPSGQETVRRKFLSAHLSSLYPLIRLCQLACDVEHGVELKTASFVDFVQIPRVGVAINRSGGADLWKIEPEYVPSDNIMLALAYTGPGHRYPFTRLHSPVAQSLRMPGPVFEATHAGPLDPAEFDQAWQQLGAPLLRMRGHPTLSRLQRAIDNAIVLVSSSLYGIGGSLTLHLVMATEAILNPFGNRSDLSERFALFVAAILGDTCDERRKWYDTAKKLYRYRCGAVHAADFVASESEADGSLGQSWTARQTPIAQEAWSIFRRCLSAVVEWANEQVAAKEPCNERAFQEFYLSKTLR